MLEHLLDGVPVWGFFLFVLLISLLPIEVGQRLGAQRRRRIDHEPEGPVGSVVGATLALLGFMVALIVSSATARFDARKEALIEGVNAIEAAFRNSLLLPEPHRSESRKLILEYAEFRLQMPELYSDPVQLRDFDKRVRQLQAELWSHAEALAEQDRNSEIYSLYATSLNDMNSIHNKRLILGAEFRIPFFVWFVLMVVTVITMLGVGFMFGLTGNRSVIANLLLAFTFALVLTLVFDLEQPAKGVVSVNQQPMHDLVERMHSQL